MKRILGPLLVMLACSPARAGDFATLNALGFSPDGRVFVFEQYGVQDGSGFPYAQMSFIDLEEDRHLAASPVRVRLETDGATLDEARSRLREDAAALLAAHAPEASPGLVVAANPPTELSADPHRVRFLPRAIEPTLDEPVELVLSLLDLPGAPDHCLGFGHAPAGFRLERVRAGETLVIHDETRIPESRNCPFDYRIAEIRVLAAFGEPSRAVAVIGVKSVGFEGPDMRYIAVPLPINER